MDIYSIVHHFIDIFIYCFNYELGGLKMKKHYFTFGQNSYYHNHVQIIYAESPEQAEDKMFELWGSQWAFQYTEEQWQASISEGFFKNIEKLPPVFC